MYVTFYIVDCVPIHTILHLIRLAYVQHNTLALCMDVGIIVLKANLRIFPFFFLPKVNTPAQCVSLTKNMSPLPAGVFD